VRNARGSAHANITFKPVNSGEAMDYGAYRDARSVARYGKELSDSEAYAPRQQLYDNRGQPASQPMFEDSDSDCDSNGEPYVVYKAPAPGSRARGFIDEHNRSAWYVTKAWALAHPEDRVPPPVVKPKSRMAVKTAVKPTKKAPAAFHTGPANPLLVASEAGGSIPLGAPTVPARAGKRKQPETAVVANQQENENDNLINELLTYRKKQHDMTFPYDPRFTVDHIAEDTGLITAKTMLRFWLLPALPQLDKQHARDYRTPSRYNKQMGAILLDSFIINFAKGKQSYYRRTGGRKIPSLFNARSLGLVDESTSALVTYTGYKVLAAQFDVPVVSEAFFNNLQRELSEEGILPLRVVEDPLHFASDEMQWVREQNHPKLFGVDEVDSDEWNGIIGGPEDQAHMHQFEGIEGAPIEEEQENATLNKAKTSRNNRSGAAMLFDTEAINNMPAEQQQNMVHITTVSGPATTEEQLTPGPTVPPEDLDYWYQRFALDDLNRELGTIADAADPSCVIPDPHLNDFVQEL